MSERTPMNVEMFKPVHPVYEGSPHEGETLPRDTARVLHKYYGPLGLRLAASSLILPPQEFQTEFARLNADGGLYERIDQDFYSRFCTESGGGDCEARFKQSLEVANNAVRTVPNVTLPPGFEHFFTLDNLTAFTSHLPHQRLEVYSQPAYREQRFEIQRQLLLAKIAVDFDTRDRGTHVETWLSNFQRQLDLDPTFYTRGHKDFERVDIWHDKKTNAFLGLRNSIDLSSIATLKTHFFQVRESPDVGLILTQPRKKRPERAVLKVYDKALKPFQEGKGDGQLRENEDIHDLAGFMFTVLAGEPERAVLMDKVKTRIMKNNPNALIYDDNDVDGRSDIEGPLSWKRIKVELPDVGETVEFIFHTLESFTNYRFQTEPMGPTRTDRAHDLFDFYRMARLLPQFFPKDVFPGIHEKVDINTLLAMKEQQILNTLKTAGEVYVRQSDYWRSDYPLLSDILAHQQPQLLTHSGSYSPSLS